MKNLSPETKQDGKFGMDHKISVEEEIQALKARVDSQVKTTNELQAEIDYLVKSCSQAFDGVLKLMNTIDSLQEEIKKLKECKNEQ